MQSSWARGRYKRYPYYLCQQKSCASYGKSIPRDKLEGDFEVFVRALEPSPAMLAVVKAMFNDAWQARVNQAKGAAKSIKRQINDIDSQIDALLGRIMNASTNAVIGTYEEKIADLEKSKIRLQDSLTYQAPKKGRAEDFLELSLKFLSSPWKIWETGNFKLRRLVLRLAFTEGFSYHRIEGPRTPKTTLPFKALGVFSGGMEVNGARMTALEPPIWRYRSRR